MSISNTYQPNAPQAKTGTGSAISNREDLSNELTLLAPEETPLLSLCAKGKSSGTFSEWTADVLSAPSTAGISEGTDVTAFDDKFASRARLGNYTQIFRRDYIVSNLQQAVSSVGPANVAQAEAKSMRELKRDVEAAICSDNDRSVENGAGTPYALRGLGNWLSSSGPSDVPAAYRTPTASILTAAAPTDTTFNDIIASIYTVNGESNNLTLIAGVALRKVISNFQRSSIKTLRARRSPMQLPCMSLTLASLMSSMATLPVCQTPIADMLLTRNISASTPLSQWVRPVLRTKVVASVVSWTWLVRLFVSTPAHTARLLTPNRN
jgi:hypothetical protein